MSDKMILHRTSDLYWSSYLVAIDITLETTEQEINGNSKKVVFVFRMKESDLIKLKALFFGGTGTVKAKKLVDAIRNLKSLCHTV